MIFPIWGGLQTEDPLLKIGPTSLFVHGALNLKNLKVFYKTKLAQYYQR